MLLTYASSTYQCLVTKFCKSMICVAISSHTSFPEQVDCNVPIFMNCLGHITNILYVILMTSIGSINPSLRNDSASSSPIEELLCYLDACIGDEKCYFILNLICYVLCCTLETWICASGYIKFMLGLESLLW